MKKNSLVLLTALMLGSTAVVAEEAKEAQSDFDVTGYLTGTNNFMYRGLSLSANSAAVQGQFSLEHKSGFYATLWASNTRLQVPSRNLNSPNLEGNFLAGYTNNITDDLAFDIGYLRTFYPGGNSVFDFNDFYGTLMYKGISAGLSYSDDFFAETGTALYGFLAYDNKIINDVSLHAKVGYTRNRSRDFLGLFGVDKAGWAHYELGLSHPLPKDFEISGVYHWTTGQVKDGFDIPGFGTNRFQFNLTKSF
jgi:uncharacterized protein (TIGR02001 family)